MTQPVRHITASAKLKSLGHPDRLSIFLAIEEQPMSVGDIAEVTDIAAYDVSRSLKTLTKAGLITGQASGKYRLYSVKDASLAQALRLIEEA